MHTTAMLFRPRDIAFKRSVAKLGSYCLIFSLGNLSFAGAFETFPILVYNVYRLWEYFFWSRAGGQAASDEGGMYGTAGIL
jgi:hypothetical protein